MNSSGGGYTLRQIFTTLFLTSTVIFITVALITFPDESLEASIRGLHMWLEVVFPSLLPFFITAELLIAFGVVRFIGVIFEPIMRPLFNVPGAGSFAWIMGMASGFPSGAKMSVRLREENQLSKVEAERLLSFTNSASPLFIFGAVSVGFFHDAKLGLLIAASHYIGNFLVGLCMRFYGKSKKENKVKKKPHPSIHQALREMHRSRMRDKRLFGEILGDAVLTSIRTLVMVGGFIILFSVFTELLFLIRISPFVQTVFSYILELFSLPSDLSLPLFSGLFEITLGAQLTSSANVDALVMKLIIISFILGFNGLSIQAQVSSIISQSDIRFLPYFISRILHGIIASILTVLLFKPLYLQRMDHSIETSTINNEQITSIFYVLKQVGPIVTILFLAISITIYYKRSIESHIGK